MQTTGARPLLKVATLNTWHGRAERDALTSPPLETRAERLARLDRQVAVLQKLDADVLFLQELNPLPFRAHWFSKKLGMRVAYASCHTGIKLTFGLPSNLNEGIALLYRSDWQHQFLGVKRLTGELNFHFPIQLNTADGGALGLQLRESRVALALRFFIPREKRMGSYDGRTSLIAAVTQLFAGQAQTQQVEEILNNECTIGHITKDEAGLIRRNFRMANSRRLNEVDNLAGWLESLRRPDEPIILGGDFNCEPGSPPYNALTRRGWTDLWMEANNSLAPEDSATWDTAHNSLAHRILCLSDPQLRGRPTISNLHRHIDSLPRRVDFLFGIPAKNEPTQKKFQLGASGYLGHVGRFGFMTGNPLDPQSLTIDDYADYMNHTDFSTHTGHDARLVSHRHGVFAEFNSTQS